MTATTASYRAELLVLRRWPAAWVLVLLPALALLLTSYATPYLFYRTAGNGVVSDAGSPLQTLYTLSPSQAVTLVTTSYGGYAAIPALILGALVSGNDWGNGYLKTALSQGPGRAATAVGQTLAVLSAATTGVVITYLTAGAASAAVAILDAEELPEPAAQFPLLAVTATGVAVAVLISTVYAAAGLVLGTVFRSAGAAVAAALVWIVGVQVLFGTAATQLGGSYAALNDALPNSNATTLSTALGPIIGSTTELEAPAVTAYGTAAAILAVYLAAFILLNTALLSRRGIP